MVAEELHSFRLHPGYHPMETVVEAGQRGAAALCKGGEQTEDDDDDESFRISPPPTKRLTSEALVGFLLSFLGLVFLLQLVFSVLSGVLLFLVLFFG